MKQNTYLTDAWFDTFLDGALRWPNNSTAIDRLKKIIDTFEPRGKASIMYLLNYARWLRQNRPLGEKANTVINKVRELFTDESSSSLQISSQ